MAISLAALCFFVFVGVTIGQPCFHNNQIYNVDSFWYVGPTKICECKHGSPVSTVTCHDNLGHCRGTGDVHYTSFDGYYFDFQGICRYELTRDCDQGAFSIAVQQEKWSVKSQTSISEAFDIDFGIYHLRLYKPGPVVEIRKHAGLPIYTGAFYDDENVRCEMFKPYMMVSLKKLKIWFRWDFNWRFEVWADQKYKNHVCGICGNWDGNGPNDVKLTPNGHPVNPNRRDWGIAWRTVLQPSRCANGVEPDNGPFGRRRRSTAQNLKNQKTCQKAFQVALFGECKKKLPTKAYIDSCILELEACQEKRLKGCMGLALDPFIQGCEDKHVIIPDTWKKPYGVQDCIEKEGTRTVKYQHLSEWSEKCKTHKCNNGKKTTKTTCLSPRRGCLWPGKAKRIPDGKTHSFRCQIYTCNDGKFSRPKVDPNCCWDKAQGQYVKCDGKPQ